MHPDLGHSSQDHQHHRPSERGQTATPTVPVPYCQNKGIQEPDHQDKASSQQIPPSSKRKDTMPPPPLQADPPGQYRKGASLTVHPPCHVQTNQDSGPSAHLVRVSHDPQESAPNKNSPEEEKEAFDVESAQRRLRIHPQTHNDQTITIFTLNMDGLRTKYKKGSLKALAHHLQFTIGVTTDTHPLDAEVDALAIPNYLILEKAGNSKHRGGVPILARSTTPCWKLARTRQPPEPIDT